MQLFHSTFFPQFGQKTPSRTSVPQSEHNTAPPAGAGWPAAVAATSGLATGLTSGTGLVAGSALVVEIVTGSVFATGTVTGWALASGLVMGWMFTVGTFLPQFVQKSIPCTLAPQPVHSAAPTTVAGDTPVAGAATGAIIGTGLVTGCILIAETFFPQLEQKSFPCTLAPQPVHSAAPPAGAANPTAAVAIAAETFLPQLLQKSIPCTLAPQPAHVFCDMLTLTDSNGDSIDASNMSWYGLGMIYNYDRHNPTTSSFFLAGIGTVRSLMVSCFYPSNE